MGLQDIEMSVFLVMKRSLSHDFDFGPKEGEGVGQAEEFAEILQLDEMTEDGGNESSQDLSVD
jgi:hypothetical protein